MPSTATITSFYIFTGNSRPRVGQVNSNFSLFRGHLIPIDPNVAQATNQTYDLGSSEHRWRRTYVRKLDITLTTTASLTVQADTAGAFSFRNNGVEIFKVSENGLTGINEDSLNGMTTSGGIGDVAASPAINMTLTSSGHIAGSTCTLQTNGRPVMVGLIPNNSTTTGSYIRTLEYQTTAIQRITSKISFVRDGTIVSATEIRSGSGDENVLYPPGMFVFYDFSDSGTYKYSLYNDTITAQTQGGTTTAAALQLSNVRVFAIEL